MASTVVKNWHWCGRTIGFKHTELLLPLRSHTAANPAVIRPVQTPLGRKEWYMHLCGGTIPNCVCTLLTSSGVLRAEDSPLNRKQQPPAGWHRLAGQQARHQW